MQLLDQVRQERGWTWTALGAVCALPVAVCAFVSSGTIDAEAPRPLASSTKPGSTTNVARPTRAPKLPSDAAPQSTMAPALFAVRTPLGEEALAAHIAAAWRMVVGRPIQRQTLAVLWAHAALETGRGKKMLGYNFAGLKGQAPKGTGRLLWTWEEGSQGPQRVRRTFRVYASAEQGAHDYVLLLTTRHRRATRAAERGSPTDFVAALADSDYFTHDSEQYARSVSSLVLEYLKENPGRASGTEVGARAQRDELRGVAFQ